MKDLYTIRYVFETVVVAESKEDAEKVAWTYFVEAAGDLNETTELDMEIRMYPVGGAPKNWTNDMCPYGDGELAYTTIGEIIDDVHDWT